MNATLTNNLVDSKIMFQKEDGNFIVLEVESISQHIDENGKMIEVIFVKEKGKKE
jgi:hypothetical protein